ncbi:PH domain-containing protein [Bacillus arachidis]|uniref:PH domain-containing protein n=1 Tax=Bacillus arachidis TaxID=2819290 RepID=UPI00255CB604|nr:PH domain-containing protein [Bacillus arachidis]WIY62125.1 PH domain-containing protein [Bacillus arachidis]
MKFKIKQNPIHMIIFLLTIFIFIAMLFTQDTNNIYFSCMILLNIINFLFIYRSTYRITDKSLIIKHYFTNTEIPFKDIQQIKCHGKSLNSTYWSRQRLEIMYGLFNTLTVCVPKEEEEFINLLKDKCPNIKIIDKPINQ